MILSEKYLKSPNCMFELYQSWVKKQADFDLFNSTVRAGCLPCARIGTFSERGAIAKYWEKQSESYVEFIGHIGPSDLRDWHLTKQYAQNISEILYMINDCIIPREWDKFLEYAFAP